MYATKRRQRNFKRIRTTEKNKNNNELIPHPQQPQQQPLLNTNNLTTKINNNLNNSSSNPSKRHRERLNGELETVASLLPYDESTIQRLDKLSVLRLAVSYLQIKAHFQVCSQLALLQPNGRCFSHPYFKTTTTNNNNNNNSSFFSVPSLFNSFHQIPIIDTNELFYSSLAQKALGAFLLILHLDGDIFYVTESIEIYLGFQQSDILHQSLFEMIHSEDREELRSLLQRLQQLSSEENNENLATQWDIPIVLRFRCLLDNTCGFVRVELKTKILKIHSHQNNGLSSFISPQFPQQNGRGRRQQQQTTSRLEELNGSEGSYSPLINSFKRWGWALIAICIPFVPPLQMNVRLDDPILKSKHSLDMGIQSIDSRLKQILELNNENNNCLTPSTSSFDNNSEDLLSRSFYYFIHPSDVKYFSDAHEMVIKSCSSGLMIYRLISVKSKNIYYVQTSFRLFFKSSKPDSIGANHRILTEVDGESLLEKRKNIKSKFLSFDDTLLQSPRIFQQPINLSVPPIPTTTLNNNSPKLSKNILLIKENNKNKSNSIEGISSNEKLKKKLTTTTTSKKYKKHNKNENEESKIVKKLISKEVKQRGEEEESSSFLNENVNKEIIYREDLNINLVEDNNNNVNQHLNIPPTTTTNNIYYNNNNLNEDVSSAMLSTFPYYYYYCCISPNQQQNLFGSLIMDLTNNEGGDYLNNNNCIIPDYWTSAVMAAVVDINNEENNNNEMLNNQAIPLPILQPPLDPDLASSIFHWPQIFPQNNSPTSSGTTTTSILPHLYPLPQQQPNTYTSTNINNQAQKNPVNPVFPPQYTNNNISSILPSTSILPPETQQQKSKTNLLISNQQTFNPTTSQTSFEHFPTFPTNLLEQQKHFKQQNVFPQNYYN